MTAGGDPRQNPADEGRSAAGPADTGYSPPAPDYPAPPPYGAPQYGAPQYGSAPYGHYGEAYPPPPGYAPPPEYGTPYPVGYGYPAGQQGTNPLAIFSLVASVVGLLCGIGSIIGIVLGAIAINQIKRSGQAGYGLAVAGVVVGVASLAISLVWMALAFT